MLYSRLKRSAVAVKKFVLRFLVMFLTAALLASLGSLLYILFYNVVIPEISVSGPLNFLFRDCGNKRCSHPTAAVDFNTPEFDFMFKRGEQYKFVVDLLVPESPSNHHVGMFILAIEFVGEASHSEKGVKSEIFKKDKKSTMLRYKSPLLHTLSSIVYSPFLVYGITEEAQTITTEVVSGYEEKTEFSLKSINVIIESHRLDIYEAHLTVQAKLEGFRYYMYHYPIFSFIIGAPIFLIPVIAIFFSVTSNSFEKKKKLVASISSRLQEERLDSEASKKSDTETVQPSDNDTEKVEENDLPNSRCEDVNDTNSSKDSERSSVESNPVDKMTEDKCNETETSSAIGSEELDEGSIEVLVSSDTSYDMCDAKEKSDSESEVGKTSSEEKTVKLLKSGDNDAQGSQDANRD